MTSKTREGNPLRNVVEIKLTAEGNVLDKIKIGRVDSNDKFRNSLCIEDGQYGGSKTEGIAIKTKIHRYMLSDGTNVFITEDQMNKVRKKSPPLEDSAPV